MDLEKISSYFVMNAHQVGGGAKRARKTHRGAVDPNNRPAGQARASREGDNPALHAKLEEIVKKGVKEAIEEREEQERRGPYLIIANIPESNKRTEEERKVDKNQVTAILERTALKEGKLNEVTVEARLGREESDDKN